MKIELSDNATAPSLDILTRILDKLRDIGIADLKCVDVETHTKRKEYVNTSWQNVQN